MRDFRGGNKGRGKRFGSRGGDLHDAVCSKCGQDCKVPFRPSGEKPVFCSDCFDGEKRGGDRKFSGGNDRSYGRDRQPRRPENNYKPQLDAIERKLDMIIEALQSE